MTADRHRRLYSELAGKWNVSLNVAYKRTADLKWLRVKARQVGPTVRSRQQDVQRPHYMRYSYWLSVSCQSELQNALESVENTMKNLLLRFITCNQGSALSMVLRTTRLSYGNIRFSVSA
jgi:hypothetical protein